MASIHSFIVGLNSSLPCLAAFGVSGLNISTNMADLKDFDNQEEEEPTIDNDVVVTKYKMAGDMANSKLFGQANRACDQLGLKKCASKSARR